MAGKEKLKKFESWDDYTSSTFLHEYIHFLQDITSAAGLFNVYIRGELIRYATILANNSKDHTIHVPIDIDSAKFNIAQNWKLYDHSIGYFESDIATFIDYSPIQKEELVDDNSGTRIPINEIMLECIDVNGKRVSVPFGTIQLQECMAKAIEEYIYPALKNKSPYNPYYIARDLANKILPGIKNKPLTLIALYDRALQSSVPGYSFVKYLEAAKADGHTFESLTPEFIYKEWASCKSSSPLSVINGKSFHDSYTKIANLAKGVITELTGGIWLLQNVTNWAISTLNKGEALRSKIPQLFTDIAQSGRIQENTPFRTLLDLLGTPLITNDKDSYDLIKPNKFVISKKEMIDVYTMMQLHLPFICDNDYECPLQWYCKHRPFRFIIGPHIDNNCRHTPWAKQRIQGECVFRQWWRFKGFKDVKFMTP